MKVVLAATNVAGLLCRGAAKQGSQLAVIDGADRFKVPNRVEGVNELPHSVAGKVAKGRLHAALARSARVR